MRGLCRTSPQAGLMQDQAPDPCPAPRLSLLTFEAECKAPDLAHA